MLEHVMLKVRHQISSCAAMTMPHSAGDSGDPIGDPCACLKPRSAALTCCKARARIMMVGTSSVQMRTCRVALPLRSPRKNAQLMCPFLQINRKDCVRLDAVPLPVEFQGYAPCLQELWLGNGIEKSGKSWLRHRNGSAAPCSKKSRT